jgi:lipopolysaccharide/colanic/teichoic acid biosynthesis glycosyltransferase
MNIIRLRACLFDVFKRFIDIFGSLFLLVLFSPIMIVTAILVKFSSSGPIIFKQLRIGRGKTFWMYKFRTMHYVDNDKKLEENYPELWRKYKQSGWKLPMETDPRITLVGRKIRSLTIDEFPQLFNVLKGEMSLVGPRAYRDEELREYAKNYPRSCREIELIRRAKPGITGLWQISGRNILNFEQRARLDAYYLKHRSFIQEIIILLKTPQAMLSRW